LVTWSADVVADDWFRRITIKTIVQKAIQRLEVKGRGVLLLHDIHPATAMALPMLLKELKARGFHVVQVVAAGDQPKFVPELLASPATQKTHGRPCSRCGSSNKSDLQALDVAETRTGGVQSVCPLLALNGN
jgi:hypothetical protein